MHDHEAAPRLTALQGAAILIISRLFVFFCTDIPFSSAYAAGMLAAAGVQGMLAVLLLHLPARIAESRLLLTLCRCYAACRSVMLCAMLYALLIQTRAPHPLPVMAAAVPVLMYTVSRPPSAAAYTATVLLFLSGIAFLLLPLAALRTANAAALCLPDSAAAAFRREWLFSGECWLLPLLMRRQTRRDTAHAAAGWAAAEGILLPLTVLLGTVQNGRLRGMHCNPFFLLLAESPLSDAVRTDGFWLVLAVSCGITAITFAVQSALMPYRDAVTHPASQRKDRSCI